MAGEKSNTHLMDVTQSNFCLESQLWMQSMALVRHFYLPMYIVFTSSEESQVTNPLSVQRKHESVKVFLLLEAQAIFLHKQFPLSKRGQSGWKALGRFFESDLKRGTKRVENVYICMISLVVYYSKWELYINCCAYLSCSLPCPLQHPDLSSHPTLMRISMISTGSNLVFSHWAPNPQLKTSSPKYPLGLG